jgi:hypothetical protein
MPAAVLFFILFNVLMEWDSVSVEPRSLKGILSIPQMIHEWIWSSGGIILTWVNMEQRWNNTDMSEYGAAVE